MYDDKTKIFNIYINEYHRSPIGFPENKWLREQIWVTGKNDVESKFSKVYFQQAQEAQQFHFTIFVDTKRVSILRPQHAERHNAMSCLTIYHHRDCCREAQRNVLPYNIPSSRLLKM